MAGKRYETGRKDGARAVLSFLWKGLSGSHSSYIETDLLKKWLEKAGKRFLREQ